MLSKLLQHARNILPAQITLFSKEANREASSATAMVTTRQNRGRNSDPVPDTPVAAESLSSDVTSSGSKKRRRPQHTSDLTSHKTQSSSNSTTSTRKRQRLPLREKDEPQFEMHTHIAVEIPVRDITQEDTPMWTVPEQTLFEANAHLTEDQSSALEGERESSLIGIGSGVKHLPGMMDDEGVKEAVSTLNVSGNASERARKTKAELNSNRNPNPTPELGKTANISEKKQPKHKRFGSEEPEAQEIEQDVETETKGNEDISSDDDAPEIVAKDDAQGKVADTARSAAKAIELQDAVLRKKRKERDEQLKKQVEATRKKRKHIKDGGDGHDTFVSLQNSIVGNSQQDAPRALSGGLEPSKSGSTKTKTKIPEFLPMEYLEDEVVSDSGSLSLTPQVMVRKSKKTKFPDSTVEKSKDRRKGSTIYRVANPYGDSLLAPKAAKHARSMKESWLNGQRGSSGAKKVVRGGFFRK